MTEHEMKFKLQCPQIQLHWNTAMLCHNKKHSWSLPTLALFCFLARSSANPWNLQSDGVFYANQVAGGWRPLGSLGRGLLAREANLRLEGWNFASLPDLLGEGRGVGGCVNH